jgi:type IV pilus assembly protein PilW
MRRLARGFSLVELLVAMALGLVLITAALQVFLGNRQTQSTESSVARVQEAGRLALGFIGEDLRLAGFYGSGDLKRSAIPMAKAPASDLCASRTESVDVLNVANDFDHFDKFVDDSIRVYSKLPNGNSWTPAAPGVPITTADVPGDVRPDTDMLSIWYAEDTGARIPANASYSGTDDVSIVYTGTPPAESCFGPNELVLLSSASGSALFRTTNTPACTGTVTLKHATTGNCSGSLGSIKFDHFSRVMKVVHRLYYVKNTQRKNTEGNDIYSLYRYQFKNKTGGALGEEMELVEGVEYLKVSAGERVLDSFGTETGKVKYVNPASIDAKALKALRVGVLVQGLDGIRTEADTATYELLPGISVTPDSSKTLRRAFSTSIELRNRAQ